MPIPKWDKLVEKYLFMYKDGFFEWPYLSNSPKIMVKSVIEMPINRHKVKEQAIYSNNPFCKGILRYREIEEGFWLLATQLDIKQNIRAKAIYGENELSDYYYLTFSVFEYGFPLKNSDGKEVVLLSTCWTFYKPKTEVATYFYKETTGKFYNLVFSKKWADKNIFHNNSQKKEAIDDFLNSKKGFYTWLDIAPKVHGLAKEIAKIIESENQGRFNMVDLKIHGLNIITEFFKHSFEDNRIHENVSLSNLDYYNIAKAEKMILHNLTAPFVGVEHIALDVNTSPTKLKSNFKTVFGFPMLQYHKEKNLLLAMQLILNSDIQIQIIAAATGYESASKFTANFKKRFGKMPSEFR
jgi:AraC-like DNA-binding protein